MSDRPPPDHPRGTHRDTVSFVNGRPSVGESSAPSMALRHSSVDQTTPDIPASTSAPTSHRCLDNVRVPRPSGRFNSTATCTAKEFETGVKEQVPAMVDSPLQEDPPYQLDGRTRGLGDTGDYPIREQPQAPYRSGGMPGPGPGRQPMSYGTGPYQQPGYPMQPPPSRPMPPIPPPPNPYSAPVNPHARNPNLHYPHSNPYAPPFPGAIRPPPPRFPPGPPGPPPRLAPGYYPPGHPYPPGPSGYPRGPLPPGGPPGQGPYYR